MPSTPIRLFVRSVVVAGLAAAAGAGGATAALVDLPPGGQVNDDPAAGISPTQAAGAVDLAAGALTAGAAHTPWAVFEQAVAGSTQQIFVREFVNGAWVTRGPSLNLRPGVDGEAPSIDFAGAGRTVPWASWYEPDAGGKTQIFASRFAAAAGKWLAAGQDRASSAPASPSLNINTTNDAENPSVAGGATVAGDNPEPWVAWQETDGSTTAANQRNQIFVSRGVKTAAATCSGFFPGTGPVVNGFCWQALGHGRVSPTSLTGTTDPSLNIDRTREGIEPDIAFTGPSDTVPWVVWYETGPSGAGLPGNELVFAAKGVRDATAIGGFKWVAVGTSASADIGPGAGVCSASSTAIRACSLNRDGEANARDARVAAGAMAPGVATSPWVAWTESTSSGKDAIFVSHLVGDRFVLANGGQPISPAGVVASDADITFSGNTPHVTWRENGGNVGHGHFEGTGADPRFVLDGIVAAQGPAEHPRAPLTSLCTASPATGDGAACPGGRVGDVVMAFTDTTSGVARLLAKSVQPSGAQTLPASAVGATAATLNATVQPAGARTRTFFEYGPSTSYGAATAARLVGPASPVTFTETLSGLAPSSTLHYRVVVQTDLGRIAGADQVFRTANLAPTLGVSLPNKPRVKARRPATVAATLTLNEPAQVRVTVKRGTKIVRVVNVNRTSAGKFVVKLRLGNLSRQTTFTVKVRARDTEGATTSVTKKLTVRVRR